MSKQKTKRRKRWHRQKHKPRGDTFAKHVGRRAKRDDDKAELESKIKTLQAKQCRIHEDFAARDRQMYHEMRLRLLAG